MNYNCFRTFQWMFDIEEIIFNSIKVAMIFMNAKKYNGIRKHNKKNSEKFYIKFGLLSRLTLTPKPTKLYLTCLKFM